MPPLPIFLTACPDYSPGRLGGMVAGLLEAAGFRPAPGDRVLAKPNLVAAKGGPLSCTHPAVVRAACDYLLACGARVVVADSPAFGTAESVARRIGLAEALRGLPVSLVTLGRPRSVPLPSGLAAAVSADALDADSILNLPKLKAHSQLRLTGAVKNLFGCVVGFRKALAHCRYGDQGRQFESLLVEVMAVLPPGFSLIDGITAMSRQGPTGGDPNPLGLLGAGASPVAMDTAVYTVLGVRPGTVPLWAEALRRGLPGADPAELVFPVKHPSEFDASSFVVPDRLSPVTFHPLRLVRGRLKSLCARFS
jgi:uncharacterized protein (DUF362 family)